LEERNTLSNISPTKVDENALATTLMNPELFTSAFPPVSELF
jgi:hypothetical protein